MTSDYRITPHLKHVRDQPDDQNAQIVDAMVASGDCFVTMATQLDSMIQNGQSELPPEVEHQIRTLLYLQRHYRIVKKSAGHQQ